MPDKTQEMSLETRLWASLRIQRRKTPGPRVQQGPRSATFPTRDAISEAGKVSILHPTRKCRKSLLRAGNVPQNPQYLIFVRLFPCVLNGLVAEPAGYTHVCSGKIEAAHTGPRGRGQKAADESALPICTSGHRTGRFAHHRAGRKFWAIWGLDRESLVAKFNALFLERNGSAE